MALAYGSFQELSHQLRFLLFEIGIGLPQNSIDYFINLAHRNTLKRLQHATSSEKLINSSIISHHVHDFVNQLQCQLKTSTPESQFYQWANLRDDLNESIANEALTLAYQYNWNTKLKKELGAYNSLWQWLSTEVPSPEAFLFLEQWGSHQQSYLPTSFSRNGCTRREVLQTSAEFQAKITAHWCAVHKNEIQHSSGLSEYTQLMKQEFTKEYMIWREKMLHQRLSPDDYYPVPVHPCQWRKELQMAFAPLTDAKLMLLYPNHQSLMVLSKGYMLPNNKTQCLIRWADHPSASSMSNAIDGSIVWKLNALLESANHYQNTLFLSSNLAELKLKNEQFHNNFSVSIHKKPNSQIPEQHMVPLTSLFIQSPISDKPLLIEIIESGKQNPAEFFSEYCDKLFAGPMDLLLKHGIAFNLQAEDVYITFENSRPSALIIRNISPINGFANSPDTERLSLCFIQSYLINNLTPWIQCMNDYFQIPLTQLWRIARHCIEKQFDKLSLGLDSKVISQQKFLILNSPWLKESLFQMSLHPTKNRRIALQMPNYLAQ